MTDAPLDFMANPSGMDFFRPLGRIVSGFEFVALQPGHGVRR